jgi:hypothetical protein
LAAKGTETPVQPWRARQLPPGKYTITEVDRGARLQLCLVTVRNTLTGELVKVPAQGAFAVGSSFVVGEPR